MKNHTIFILFIVLALSGTPTQAIELNPFSIIKGAVEAAVEDRSGSDIKKDLETLQNDN